MPNKKPTDAEIAKALNQCTCSETNCYGCPYWDASNCSDQLCMDALDLINRLQADCENYKQIAEHQQSVSMERGFEIKRLKADIERLENAYKQCAWERDIFAEDMKEEIKKDCSYLMLDIKTIKTEAYKECIEKVKEQSNKMELVCSGALVRTDYTITDEEIDNLLKELVGDSDV